MSKSFFQEILRRFVKSITPPPLGGLFVSDWSLEYLELKETPKLAAELNLTSENSESAFLRLPPGIIEFGKIKDRENFVFALKEIHKQITADSKKVVSVVLTIPASDVYVQSFNLPRLAEKGLSQAAELNAKMISPIPIKNAYYGWQRIGENLVDGGQIELLGAFVNRALVDEFTISLREAGFGVAVLEFSSLSLVRNLNTFNLLNKNSPYLAIEINSLGLDFMILKNNNIYFDYSYSWGSVQGEERNISLDNLRRILKGEIQKILNFYFGRWSGIIKDFIIITPTLSDEFLKIVKEEWRGIEVQVLSSGVINPVLGAALRGLIPRVKDADISLTSVSVAEAFLQDQIMNFASIWRNILITTFGFVLLIFVVAELFLIQTANDLNQATTINLRPNDKVDLVRLQGEANEFNKLVEFVKYAKEKDRNLSPLLKLLSDYSGSRVRIDRVSLPTIGQSGVITGETDSEEAAILFKNRVAQIPQFSNVDLPLTNLVPRADGRVAFTLNFKIKSLDSQE